MRTICITLVGVLITLNLTAQISSDTTYSKTWNEKSQSWENYDRIITVYNNQNPVSELIQVFENNIWENYSLREYSYENGRLLVETEMYWDDHHQEWIHNYRKLYSYNSEGQVSSILHQNVYNGVYFNSSREIMRYSADGNLMEKEVETFDEAWNSFLKYQYYYLSNDLLMEENLTYTGDGQQQDVKFTVHYSYNQDGKLLSKVKTRTRSGKEENLVREFYTYDESGRMSEQLISSWSSFRNEWKNENRAVLNNDLNGYVCSVLNQSRRNRDWENYLFTEFNGNNAPLTGEEVTGDMAFTIYPVNFGKQAKIEFNNPYGEGYYVKVINRNGELVDMAYTDNNSVSIDARNLIKGLYFIELQGSSFFSGKFSIK
ncbi:MAG: hypothetical protein Kow00127_23810 [Bacteroidales bacterium]